VKSKSEIINLLKTIAQQNAKALELLARALDHEQEANSPTPTSVWLPTEEAWIALSLSSAEALRRKRRQGVFELGHHYRLANHDPHATQKRYEFHIERCLARLADPPRNWAKPQKRA
jgi:hypothetical protein